MNGVDERIRGTPGSYGYGHGAKKVGMMVKENGELAINISQATSTPASSKHRKVIATVQNNLVHGIYFAS